MYSDLNTFICLSTFQELQVTQSKETKNFYHIQAILGERTRKGEKELKVLWLGLPKSQASVSFFSTISDYFVHYMSLFHHCDSGSQM